MKTSLCANVQLNRSNFNFNHKSSLTPFFHRALQLLLGSFDEYDGEMQVQDTRYNIQVNDVDFVDYHELGCFGSTLFFAVTAECVYNSAFSFSFEVFKYVLFLYSHC